MHHYVAPSCGGLGLVRVASDTRLSCRLSMQDTLVKTIYTLVNGARRWLLYRRRVRECDEPTQFREGSESVEGIKILSVVYFSLQR